MNESKKLSKAEKAELKTVNEAKAEITSKIIELSPMHKAYIEAKNLDLQQLTKLYDTLNIPKNLEVVKGKTAGRTGLNNYAVQVLNYVKENDLMPITDADLQKVVRRFNYKGYFTKVMDSDYEYISFEFFNTDALMGEFKSNSQKTKDVSLRLDQYKKRTPNYIGSHLKGESNTGGLYLNTAVNEYFVYDEVNEVYNLAPNKKAAKLEAEAAKLEAEAEEVK